MKPRFAALTLAAVASILGTAAIAAPPARPFARKVTQLQQQLYTCPMHSDIRWTRPGACPECGMKMVAMKAGAGTVVRQNESKTMPGMPDESSNHNHDGMEMNHNGMGGMSGGMGMGCGCMDMGGMSGGGASAGRKVMGSGSYGRGGGGGRCGC